MADAYICDAVRTPIGRYAGGLAPVRADDLGAVPLKALQERNPGVDWEAVEDVVFGCANRPARTTATSRAWPCCSPACPPPSRAAR
jgi:acetyl-CoA acetyltransferase